LPAGRHRRHTFARIPGKNTGVRLAAYRRFRHDAHAVRHIAKSLRELIFPKKIIRKAAHGRRKMEKA
jgi:hypothetical protein